MLDDFLKVYAETTIKHRGCTVHKIFLRGKVIGFEYAGRSYSTLIECFDAIDNAFISLQKSIV